MRNQARALRPLLLPEVRPEEEWFMLLLRGPKDLLLPLLNRIRRRSIILQLRKEHSQTLPEILPMQKKPPLKVPFKKRPKDPLLPRLENCRFTRRLEGPLPVRNCLPVRWKPLFEPSLPKPNLSLVLWKTPRDSCVLPRRRFLLP